MTGSSSKADALKADRDWRKRYPPNYNHRRWKNLEWSWTIIPAIMLIAVAVLSTNILYSLDSGPPAGYQANVHITVVGHQWYWVFFYNDPYGACLANPSVHDCMGNSSLSNQTQGVLYVPSNGVVEMNVTSADVVHSLNIPALGVRIDAIPGRINHYWFSIPAGATNGTSYLIQCTEFCGAGHAYMRATLIVTADAPWLPSFTTSGVAFAPAVAVWRPT